MNDFNQLFKVTNKRCTFCNSGSYL